MPFSNHRISNHELRTCTEQPYLSRIKQVFSVSKYDPGEKKLFFFHPLSAFIEA